MCAELHDRSRALRHPLVVALLMLVGVPLILIPDSAAAAAKPRSGQWCGYTNNGGSVRMEVSPDGRWLNSIDIRTPKGSVSSGEAGGRRAQIVVGKFILRSAGRGGGGGRCTRVPCRGSGQRSSTTMIRGTFRGSDTVRGAFTAPPLIGQFSAWPIDFAPCP